MSTGEPTEDEIRAAYEQQLRALRVEHVLLEDMVTLVNLGLRRTGVIEGTAQERDPTQAQLAIESIRALLPLVEQVAAEQAGQIRQALSQLQMAYVQSGGGGTLQPVAAAAAPVGGEPDPLPRRPGPESRLWVPGR
jgi:hypothetical protein